MNPAQSVLAAIEWLNTGNRKSLRLLAANIQTRDSEHILYAEHNSEEMVHFYQEMDYNDSGIIYGTLWLSDGSWLNWDWNHYEWERCFTPVMPVKPE